MTVGTISLIGVITTIIIVGEGGMKTEQTKSIGVNPIDRYEVVVKKAPTSEVNILQRRSAEQQKELSNKEIDHEAETKELERLLKNYKSE